MMSPGVKSFLQRWLVTTLGVLAATTIVDGVEADTTAGLLGASLLLGIFNAVLRPIMLVLALPLLVLTLGLFTFVINALLLSFVGWLVTPFYVEDFWAALKGAIVISIISLLANMLIGRDRPSVRVRVNRGPPPPRRRDDDTGSGPVIDV